MATVIVANSTHAFIVYTRGGSIQKTWVYNPTTKGCVNVTYNPTVFNYSPFCVGPDTGFPTFVYANTHTHTCTQ